MVDGLPVLFSGANKDLPKETDASLITPDSTSGPAEWGRYHDAVREAARTIDNPQEGDIHHFLKARARNRDNVDVPAFHEAVKRQRMADLVDISDHHIRRDGSLPRGSRMVRTQAPKGYLKKALRGLSVEDAAHLHHRLTAIGHTHESVSKFLATKVKPDIWDEATRYQVNFSEQEEFVGITFDDSSGDEDWVDDLAAALSEIKPPIINVFVGSEKTQVEVE